MTKFLIGPNNLRKDLPELPAQDILMRLQKTTKDQKLLKDPKLLEKEALRITQQNYIDSLRVGSSSDNLDWNQMVSVIRKIAPNAWIDSSCPEITGQTEMDISMRYYETPRGVKSIIVTCEQSSNQNKSTE